MDEFIDDHDSLHPWKAWEKNTEVNSGDADRKVGFFWCYYGTLDSLNCITDIRLFLYLYYHNIHRYQKVVAS